MSEGEYTIEYNEEKEIAWILNTMYMRHESVSNEGQNRTLMIFHLSTIDRSIDDRRPTTILTMVDGETKIKFSVWLLTNQKE